MIDKIAEALPEGEKEKANVLRKVVKKPNGMTFGDLAVLQELKAKFEAEGK